MGLILSGLKFDYVCGPLHYNASYAVALVPGLYSVLDVVLRATCSMVGVW
jgi:hypothetical protein